MKLSLLPFLFLCSCATYAGKDRVAVYSNCSHMIWKGGANPSLEMWNVNNSTPTRAGGSVVGTLGTAVGGVIAAGVTKGLIR